MVHLTVTEKIVGFLYPQIAQPAIFCIHSFVVSYEAHLLVGPLRIEQRFLEHTEIFRSYGIISVNDVALCQSTHYSSTSPPVRDSLLRLEGVAFRFVNHSKSVEHLACWQRRGHIASERWKQSLSAVLEELKHKIESLNGAGPLVAEQFEKISAMMDFIYRQEDGMIRTMKEQMQGGEEVLNVINGMNAITAKVKEDSNEILAEASDISTGIQKLADLSQTITQSMAEMAAGVTEVNKAMQEVNTIALNNQKNAASVTGEIEKFKV
mgnify:CR=1 FL=1